MKSKSFFSRILLLVIIAVICVVLTIGIALLAGSYSANLFDFRNLNFANIIPVLILGGFISCIVIGITVLFVAKSGFLKVKDFLSDNNGGNKK